MDTTYLIVTVVSIAVGIFITRLFGAWMLRINEVIDLQRDILNELRRQRTTQTSGSGTSTGVDTGSSAGSKNFSSPKGFTKPPRSGKSGGLFNKVDPNRKPL